MLRTELDPWVISQTEKWESCHSREGEDPFQSDLGGRWQLALRDIIARGLKARTLEPDPPGSNPSPGPHYRSKAQGHIG